MDFGERMHIPIPPPPAPKASRAPLLIAIAGLLAAAGAIVFHFSTVSRLEAVEYKMEALRQENTRLKDWASLQLKQAGEQQSAQVAAKVEELNSLREQLEEARTQAGKAAGRARAEALKSVQALEARLAEGEQKLKEEQLQMAARLTELQQTASHTESNLSEVKTDVGQIRSEVAQTRTELDAATQNLKRMTGDLGVMSGLVATNAKEIAYLKELGDRQILEFTLTRKQKAEAMVREVGLSLKKTDARRNRFTLEVIADDRVIEKKDRTTNEPVQFYVSRSRQPYEIVINKVEKDSVSGYLAVPKLQQARDGH
jgi:chromosome segregation ATPase